MIRASGGSGTPQRNRSNLPILRSEMPVKVSVKMERWPT